MKTAAGDELSDSDLLDGSDEGGVAHGDAARTDGDSDDSLFADLDGDGKGAQAGNDLEVVILDGDEGEDTKKGAAVDGDDAGGRQFEDDDDSGEVVGEDLLTADERKNYSKNVQKRIERERRLKQDAETAAASERGARVAAERRAYATEKAMVELLVSTLASSITGKTAELKAAKEAGDTDTELRLQEELDDLRAKNRDVVAAKTRLEQSGPPADAGAAANDNPARSRWLNRNRWFANPEFAAAAAATRAIDQQLAAEHEQGKFRHGKQSPEYFAEIERRLHREMPQLRSRIQRSYGTSSQPGTQRVAPVSRSSGTVRSAGAAANAGRVTLDRSDLENMRNFGLNTDPRTPEGKRDLQQYARTKRERLAQETGGRNG